MATFSTGSSLTMCGRKSRPSRVW